jgi:tetratricopeptide (TPR) repeat protein
MADIFLSYSKSDRASAERIIAALEADGLSVWWDDALTPHQAWDAFIEREIENAKAVVVLWSKNSVRSDWVRTEAHYAQENNKLVPVMIEVCSLPLAFQLRQAVNLSQADYRESDPAWHKLKLWLDDMMARTGSAPAPAESGIAQPAPAAIAAAPTRESARWTQSKPLLAGLAALVVAIGAGGWWMSSSQAAEMPDLYVDSFESGEGLPAGFADTLHDELITGLTGSTRISPIAGDGSAHANAFRITGRVAVSGDDAVFFVRMFAPGRNAPVISTRIEEESDNSSAARMMAYRFADIARCIATGASSGGQGIVLLPEEAIEPWSRYCLQGINEAATIRGKLALLEEVTQAAPDFANGWATYGNELSILPYEDLSAGQDVVDQSIIALERALDIDPGNSRALMTMGWQVLEDEPFRATPETLGRRNIPRFIEYADRAIASRPSECLCEFSEYANVLFGMGLTEDARDLFRRAFELGPTNVAAAARQIGITTLAMGDAGLAEEVADDANEIIPGSQAIRTLQFEIALSRGQYAAAADLADDIGSSPFEQQLIDILQALDAKNDGHAHEIAASLQDHANSNRADTMLIYALQLGGYPDLAAQALESAMRQGGGITQLQMVQTPVFADLRRTPTFERIVRQTGIFDYWKDSGRTPYFCSQDRAPGFCSRL